MRVFVESLSGEIISDYCFKGYIGAVNAGHDVQKVSLSAVSMMNRESLKDVLPIGSVEYMTWFMKYVHEIPVPEPLKAHKLAPNFYTLKWKEVDKLADVEFPCFIKPLNDIKKFTGFVAKSAKDFELYPELDGWDGPYLTTEIISNLLSEWRFFIHKGKIVNVSNYAGDPAIFPGYTELSDVRGLIYHDSHYRGNKLPVAYTVDIGISTGEDEYIVKRTSNLIELNDMWAIGPYGCKEDIYFTMLKDRWNQIVSPIKEKE